MLLGARQFFERRGAPTPSVPTARDYVQNGLITMWDGIENAGYGAHSQNAANFVDLVSGSSVGVGYEYGLSTNIPATPLYTIESDGVRSNDAVINRSVGIGIPYPVTGYTWNYTVEVVRKVHSFNSTPGYNPYIFCSYPSNTFVGLIGCRTGSNEIFIQYSGSANTGLAEHYNGSSVTSKGDNADGREVILHGGGTWTSGRGQFGVGNNTHITFCTSFCDATLCHIRVYSRALTASEIAANYAIDKARFNLP